MIELLSILEIDFHNWMRIVGIQEIDYHNLMRFLGILMAGFHNLMVEIVRTQKIGYHS